MKSTVYAEDVKLVPYWWEAAPCPVLPSAVVPAKVDAVIVDTGYAGLSAALTLARGGRSTLVFEAGRIGAGVSTRNGGIVGTGLKAPFGDLIARFGLDRAMAAALAGRLVAPARRVPIRASAPLRYVTPKVVAIPGDRPNGLLFRIRVDRPARGTLRLLRNGEEVWHRKVSALPERRVRLPGGYVSLDDIESVEVRLDPS